MIGNGSIVRVNGVEIGGGEFVVMAGPCAVESEAQLLAAAEAVARAGAKILRGGAFKPRTSPYDFQGLGLEGLKLLAKARQATGLLVVTEAITDTQVELVAEYADILQVGSRSMGNTALLYAVAKSGRPALLKRGMTATVDELLESAEFLVYHGCRGVILCERGIRTYGTATRNTCDLAAVPLLKQISSFPVIVDPSHATGLRDLVAPVSRAAVAIGADGLIIEVHPHPQEALSDRAQTLSTRQFEMLMQELEPYLELWRQARLVPAI